MSLLQENLAALAAHHPRVAEALMAEAGRPPAARDGEEERVRVQPSACGLPTATLDGIHIHSGRDPLREARRQAEREIAGDATAVIAVGFGLGYGPEAARALHPSIPLLIVEPDIAVFRAAMAARDLRRLIRDPAVLFHVEREPEGITRLLESLPLARPSFLRLRPLIQAQPGPYRAAEELVHSWLLRHDINVNTLNRFGRLWVRNLCRNIRAFADCAGVASLDGLFQGIPALVIAGGPSLDAIGPRLPALRERMFLVAVNTPLKACLAYGAEPDFTVVVDPQYWASRYLDWARTDECIFVAEPSACPRIFHDGPATVFLCSSLFPLGETLEAAIGEKGKLGAGGSVATSAWDFARLLGGSPLYTAGLDLGFPGMRTHCRGVYAEETWLSSCGRLAPLEGSSFRSIRDIGLFDARAASGAAVPTDRRMLLYKWWFENQLKTHPDVVSRTLCPESVAIERMPVADLQEALGLPVLRPEIDRRKEEARGIHRQAVARERWEEDLAVTMEALASQMARLESLSRRGESLCDRLRDLLAHGRDTRACLADLDGIDASILSLSARGIAGFLIQSIIHGIAGQGSGRTDTEEVIARSRAMYAGIRESAEWQRGLLRRASASLQR